MPSDFSSSGLISQTFSVSELSQKVLEMAATGVYRESVFEALKPLATKRQIREAITHAKRFGLHSVPSLRDPELGTYYQLDLVKYQTLGHALHSHTGQDADLIQKLTRLSQTLRQIVLLTQLSALLLLGMGSLCWVAGWYGASLSWAGAATGATLLWLMQRYWMQSVTK
ncbi:MAG: hypothetical protein ACKO7W_22425 [Elainella sp.]